MKSPGVIFDIFFSSNATLNPLAKLVGSISKWYPRFLYYSFCLSHPHGTVTSPRASAIAAELLSLLLPVPPVFLLQRMGNQSPPFNMEINSSVQNPLVTLRIHLKSWPQPERCSRTGSCFLDTHVLLLSPLHTLPPDRPSCCFLNAPVMTPPQFLCTHSSLSLECSSLRYWHDPFIQVSVHKASLKEALLWAPLLSTSYPSPAPNAALVFFIMFPSPTFATDLFAYCLFCHTSMEFHEDKDFCLSYLLIYHHAWTNARYTEDP